MTPIHQLASIWDEARGDLPPAQRDFRPALALGAVAWTPPVALFFWLVG